MDRGQEPDDDGPDSDTRGDDGVLRLESDDEPELPGLTDEALRLLEVAREELSAEESENPFTPIVPLAISHS
jgi:polyketide synthase 13